MMRTAIVDVAHVTIACGRPFEAVRDALVKDVPAFDPQLIDVLTSTNAAEIEERRAFGPKLWLFNTRDHGALAGAEGDAPSFPIRHRTVSAMPADVCP